jgi:hypothetical protein
MKNPIKEKFLSQFEEHQEDASGNHSCTSALMICKFPKWNRAKVYEAEITEEAINKLLNHDPKICGLPKFVTDFLNLKPSQHRETLAHRPQCYAWSPCGLYLLMPNPPYTNHEVLMEDPKKAKDEKEGFAITAWFIHPTLLAESRYSERGPVLDALKASDESLRYGKFGSKDNLEKSLFRVDSFSDLNVRDPGQPSIKDIVERSGIPYIAGPFDYRPEHIPALIALKEFIHQHLRDVYGVAEKDRVELYFHTHYGIETTTSHLHVRVNQLHHGMELSRSIFLDEIIDYLSKGKRVIDFFIEKKHIHFGPHAHAFLKTIGYSLREVDNPYYVEHASQSEQSGKTTYHLKG